MKNVWILNHYAQVPGGPGGTRHYSFARNLPKYGWRAYIIASSVELNTDRQRLGKDQKFSLMPLQETEGGFVWIRTPQYTGNGIGRIFNMFTYTFRTLIPQTTKSIPSPDIVIGSSVHPFAALAACQLARRHRVPFVFEVRDLWPQTLIDMNRLKQGSPITKLLQFIEKWLYTHSEKIIVLLPNAKEYIEPLGIPSSRIVWIPNGVDLEQFPSFPLQDNDFFTLMYFGAHGNANGLENLLHAMNILNEYHGEDLPIKLRLVGDGPRKPFLIKLARELDLNNVHFEDPIPKSKIPYLAREADAFIFNLIDSPVFKYGVSSNKLFDFMAASRPIIFCCASRNNPVNDAGAGITVKPGDPRSLFNAIVELYKMPFKERRVLGLAARRYVERNHDVDRLALRMTDVLDIITTRSINE